MDGGESQRREGYPHGNAVFWGTTNNERKRTC